jgi:alpha-galactosidase/6-phospho-beta-glucosidase family protein
MGRGRRTKCTKQTIERVAAGLRLGMTHELAAQYGGISHNAFYRYLKLGSQPDAQKCYRDFCEAIKAAEADNAARCLLAIDDAASDGSWQAAAWMLERRHRYVKQQAIHLETHREPEMEVVDPTAEDGRAMVIEHVSQLPEDLIIAALNLKNASNAK